MSRIPLRRLILVLVCLALAMVLGWRGARLSMRAADSAASSSDGSAVEVRERMGADTDEAGSENASGESLADQGETHLQAEVDELGGDAPSEDGEPSGAFVLPDENLLLPLLNSIPPSYDSINVTMGYPMSGSAIYTLLDAIGSMQMRLRKRPDGWYFYHRCRERPVGQRAHRRGPAQLCVPRHARRGRPVRGACGDE